MTTDEVDVARFEEARRLSFEAHEELSAMARAVDVAKRFAALVERGWEPRAATDPDVLEARTIIAAEHIRACDTRYLDAIREGDWDKRRVVVCTVAGIKRGRALAAEEARADSEAPVGDLFRAQSE